MYTPGKFLAVADALSRACDPEEPSDEDLQRELNVEIHVNTVKGTIPVSESKWQEIAIDTAQDPVLREVVSHVHEGWGKPVAQSCKPYSDFPDELTVLDGVLLKGVCIVVPVVLHTEMLRRIHEEHLGIEKCQRRARSMLYCPRMKTDIEKVVNNCETCVKHRYKQPKKHLRPRSVPSSPWTKVGADLFQLHGKDYLVIVDYTSNYPEVALLSNTKASEIIKQTKSMFA